MTATQTVNGTFRIIFTAEETTNRFARIAQKFGHNDLGETLWHAKVELIDGYSDWNSVANILAVAYPGLTNITPLFAQDSAATTISSDQAIHWFSNRTS